MGKKTAVQTLAVSLEGADFKCNETGGITKEQTSEGGSNEPLSPCTTAEVRGVIDDHCTSLTPQGIQQEMGYNPVIRRLKKPTTATATKTSN